MRQAALVMMVLTSCSSDPGFVGEVPTNPDALLPWLENEHYADWEREAAVHPTAGPHGTDVRAYFNTQLAGSIESGNLVHVEEAAAVKELYEAGLVVGWAVMIKTTPEPGPQSWYWYEVLDRNSPSNRFEGQGLEICAGCHAMGTDFVRTSWPQ